ncbi:hypothetical protein JTB14_026896 [Gonioctena quinquepunctata]|nr:hypothetical protein JTB14_026896 [Gonioctena quinquepunctata]
MFIKTFSSEAPVSLENLNLEFRYVPVEDPILQTDKQIMDLGFRLKGNCSAPSSYPAANITWLLNGKKINESYHRFIQSADVFAKVAAQGAKRAPLISFSGLEMEIDENNFHNGRVKLSCIASIFNLYRREKEVILEEDRPRPRPSSVLGTRDASASGMSYTRVSSIIIPFSCIFMLTSHILIR